MYFLPFANARHIKDGVAHHSLFGLVIELRIAGSDGLRFSSSRGIFFVPCSWKIRKKTYFSITVTLIFIGQEEIPDMQKGIAGCIEEGPELDREDFVIDVSMAMECVILVH